MAMAVERAEPTPPFVIGMAVLGLLAAATAGEPLLAVVDDLHWLDPTSGLALAFAARRLEHEPVVVLFARRPDEGYRLDLEDVDRLLLEGLSIEDAAALVDDVAAVAVAPSVVEKLHSSTAGNPMALVEATKQLAPEMLTGGLPLPNPLPIEGQVRSSFERQVAALPAPARRALGVLAADGTGSLTLVGPALETFGLGVADLEAAEGAQIVAVDGLRIAFRHPLVRNAVYAGLQPSERRRAHAALAVVAADAGDLEREAVHLAEATSGPDRAVADRLAHTAERAALLGGAATAAPVLERAALLTPPGATRVSRLIGASQALMLSGQIARVEGYLDEALRHATTVDERAHAVGIQAQVMVARGEGDQAMRRVHAEALRVAEVDPEKAALMLCDMALPSVRDGDTARALRIFVEADELAPPGTVASTLTTNYVGHVRLFRGDGEQGGRLIREAYAGWDARARRLSPMTPGQAVGFMFMEDYPLALELVGRSIEEARQLGAPAVIPQHLATRSEIEFLIGEWWRAHASATEAVELARSCGQRPLAGYGLVVQARIEAAWGRVEASRSHAQEVFEIESQFGGRYLLPYAHGVIGLLELGLGDAEAAAADLESGFGILQAQGNDHPGNARLGGDLIEALVRSGDHVRAGSIIETFGRHSDRTRTVWARAAVLRGRGMLAVDEEVGELFASALEMHARTTTPFELARTQLCYGERLRDQQRMPDAVGQLRPALATFQRLGAQPWADRTLLALQESGDGNSAQPASWTEVLTPRELDVAFAVAEGMSNKDAAERLFLSPKTVEFHHGHVYRKLEVRSRSQLTRLLHGAPTAALSAGTNLSQ